MCCTRFEDSRRAESDYWGVVKAEVCIKPGAAAQARKLQRCWRMVTDREAARRFRYSHLIRLRPDLMLPRSLAPHVRRHLNEARPLWVSTTTPPQPTRTAVNRGVHTWTAAGRHLGEAQPLWHSQQAADSQQAATGEIASRRNQGSVPSSAGRGEIASRRRARFPHRRPTHGWGDEVCLRRHESSGASCQVKCDESDALAGPTTLLTLPPFTPALRNDTFVNDVFWVVYRPYAPALFDHLQLLQRWGRQSQTAQQRQQQRQSVDTLCGAAPRLRASPSCTDESRHQSERTLACATGGHECMVSQALSALSSSKLATVVAATEAVLGAQGVQGTGYRREVLGAQGGVGWLPPAAVRVRYLHDMRASPQVLRLADTDDRYCAGMQLAYLCSEKRKVRRAPAANALSGDAAAAEAIAAAFAERQKRCRQADRGRHEVQTRTDASPRGGLRGGVGEGLGPHNRTARPRSRSRVQAHVVHV